MLAWKETTQRKKNQRKNQITSKVNHDNQRTKTYQQKHITKLRHPLVQSMFYGVDDSTLDSESTDPSSRLGRTLFQFFFDYEDDS